QNMARCIESCAAAAKNTSSEADSSTIPVQAHFATALVETIWTLCIEWEPDTAEDSDGRWKEEQGNNLEQTKRLVQLTRALLSQGVINHDVAKERLDPDFLEQIGAIPSATTFTRKYIRLNTALNFKQTKFNLVCEQSEGFSKLVTLIQASMSGISPHRISSDIIDYVANNQNADSPQGSVVLQALRSLPDLQSRIQNLLIDIKRLIGVFNIDPNRVLDIIIDCFMASVRFYWVFYIALLDASPWCRMSTESKKVAQLVGWKLQLYASGPASDRKFTDELLTVAALLIKHRLVRLCDIFAMLAPKNTEDIDKEFEAWLAKQKEEQDMGMGMSMGMSAGLGGGNLLSKMGGLEEPGEEGEEQGAEADSSSSAEVADEWSNQHSLLCAKLLSMGDTENALVYLKRFPDMARAHDYIADLAARIIDASTADIYRKTDCVRARSMTQINVRTAMDMADADKSVSVNAWGLPVSCSSDAASPEHQSAHPAASYVLSPLVKRPSEKFFYESFWLLDSKKQMPQISSLSSIPRVLAPWLNVAFLRLHRLPSLLIRLIRLCRYALAQSASSLSGQQDRDDQQELWLGFLRAWILPAFSLGAPSAGLSNELWLLISPLSISQRYALYGEWDLVLSSGKPFLPYIEGADRSAKPLQMDMGMDMSLDDALDDDLDGAIDGQPVAPSKSYVEIETLYNSTRRQVRSVMRRLSGDTVKLMGRQLCSLCRPTPTVSLKIILDQVCSYDNLVDSVVEAFRYLTPLDADVMFFVILRILSDPSSARTKDDGVNAAHWLQCLSTFIAGFSHRHENQRLDIVLDYILKLTVNMARAEDRPPVFELTILSDAISRLATIPFMANATEDQIMALQGGHYLRLEAFSMVSPWVLPQNATAETAIAVSSENRLTRRMAQWLTSLVVSRGQALAFAIALCVHAEKTLRTVTLPLSNMLVIYDREIERVYQLFHLLHSNLRPDKYTKLIPGPHVLATRFNLSWGLAILWGRPSISLHIAQGLKQWEDEGELVRVEVTESDAGDPNAKQQAETAPAETESDSKMDIDSAPAPPTADSEMPRVVSDLRFEVPLLPREYVDYFSQQPFMSASDAGISAEFVAVFWALTLYDIDIPVDRYKKEMDTQNALIKRVDAMVKQSTSRSKNSTLTQIRARAALTIDGLEKEMQEQRQHVSRIRRWLIAQKDYWFCMSNAQRRVVSKALIQHCILPRAVLSASDAYFCAKMLWMMHFPLATNKFSLMIVCDNIFGDSISTLLAACTENEARNYARFLNATLSYLSPLHQSEACYNERGINKWRGLVGFQQQWPYERGYLPPKSRTVRQQMPANPDPDSGDARRILPGSMMPYDDFRTVMRKWHITLTKSFLNVLDSERNDTVRNGILALREMQRSFPIISQYGRRIMEKVANIAKSEDAAGGKDAAGAAESNKNLKVMATSYGAYLSMAKKTWIPESEYYPVPPKAAARAQRAAAPSQQTLSKKQETRVQPSATATNGGGSAGGGGGGGNVDVNVDGAKVTKSEEQSQSQSHGQGAPAADTVVPSPSPTAEKPKQTPKPAVSRSVSGSNIVAAAAAAAAASTAASSSSAANSLSGSRAAVSSSVATARSEGDRTKGREHDPRRHRDKEGAPTRSRDREKERLRPEDVDKRESRSSRSSPVHHDSSAAYSEPHKRSRENTISDARNESSRQRLSTPSKTGSQLKSPNISELRISTPQQGSPHTPAGTKLSTEEADRKRRELRAQLLRQQEEKQKQKGERSQHESVSADRRDRDRGGRYSSRESSVARDSGVHSDRSRGEDREDKDGGGGGGSRRSGRRGAAKNADYGGGSGQAPSAQASGARDRGDRRQQHAGAGLQAQDDSATYDRARNAPSQDRPQQQQQQSRKRPQPHASQAPQGTGRLDHYGRGGGDHGQRRNGNSNNQTGTPVRSAGGRQANQNRDRGSEAGGQSGRKSFARDHAVNEGAGVAAGGGIGGNGGGGRRGPKRGRGSDSSRDWDEGKRHRK
ncbi:THO2 plays a role in transcriptional elongation, partial [Coemansia sp. RSA 2599]